MGKWKDGNKIQIKAEKFLIDFSTLIYILFVNVSTDLTNITGDPF